MANKAVFGAFAAVLLVAAVIGVIATVMNNTHKPLSTSENPSLSSTSVKSLCAQTDYSDVCMRTVGAVNSSASDPRALIQAAFQAALDEVNSAVHLTNNVSAGATDQFNKNAFADCKSLLEYANEELRAAMIVSDDADGVGRRADDIKAWLSAVITYQETCIDGITQPELQDSMRSGMETAAQVTSNAIAFVDALSSLFKSFDLNSLNITTSGRRLLSEEVGKYPTWLAAHDRKLLAAQSRGQLRPNVVVAQDGSGNFKSINDALRAMPKRYSGRYVIYVKAGIYKEYVMVTKDMNQVFMYGDGPRRTIVTGSKNFVDGVGTMNTATFAVVGQGFIAKSMGFSNTAGAIKHQAVALRVQADMAAFFNCRMDGYQDTLYVHALRQFYRNCIISGTVDFIFGDSAAVLQNCLIVVRRPMDNQQNTITAHGRTQAKEGTGLVIHNCRIVPDKRLFPDRFKIPSFLGRPWKAYSRTVIMESIIGDLIRPEGWMPWDGSLYLDSLYYAEYGNRGPGAGTSGRIHWRGFRVINKQTAQQFTVNNFIGGNQWVPYAGINFLGGLNLKRDKIDWWVVCKTKARKKIEEHWEDIAYQPEEVANTFQTEEYIIPTLRDPSGVVINVDASEFHEDDDDKDEEDEEDENFDF
ncbi:pectinesterase/pectinesterase inhibitor-like [Zingiber officinale]|uniref:pectinesterase/pectinesterase inhibitor-like n=1 Tax=Zingiber officinale TaxID=94328 RepID=UPI001C4AC31D|nr:pectinesterase/pectinesterase inhibitor-like [Zingiber officinale]